MSKPKNPEKILEKHNKLCFFGGGRRCTIESALLYNERNLMCPIWKEVHRSLLIYLSNEKIEILPILSQILNDFTSDFFLSLFVFVFDVGIPYSEVLLPTHYFWNRKSPILCFWLIALFYSWNSYFALHKINIIWNKIFKW